MTLPYLRLMILSLLALVFAGYHTACACAHAAQVTEPASLSHHHDLSMDMAAGECHDEPVEHSDKSHDCPRFLDRLDVKSVSLIKPEIVTLKPVLPSTAGLGEIHSLTRLADVRDLPKPPPDDFVQQTLPVNLKVRLLN